MLSFDFNNFIKEFIALHEALKVSFSGCATRLIMELFMQLANLKNLGWESCWYVKSNPSGK